MRGFFIALICIAQLKGNQFCLTSSKSNPQRDQCDTKPKTPDVTTYIAAVLEYQPHSFWDDDSRGFDVIQKNADEILLYAAKAKNQSADILVSPEYGLTGCHLYKDNPNKFVSFTQLVPNPEDLISPCGTPFDSDYFKVIKALSCGAKENQMYLVIDLLEIEPCSNESPIVPPWGISLRHKCPKFQGYFVFNTQVVFDRNGTVIARYRKQNLFNEKNITPGEADDTDAIFVTDFGVKFSLQICFDIAHEHPAYKNVLDLGIRDVIMSTAWIDELPFDLANSIQYSWSRGLGVNLLVSGYHEPENFKIGSGIFRGYVNESPVYSYDKCSGNVLLVSAVQTRSEVSESSTIEANKESRDIDKGKVLVTRTKDLTSGRNNIAIGKNCSVHQVFWNQDLSDYTTVALEKGVLGRQKSISICNHKFCCQLQYEYGGNLTYYFMAYSGFRPLVNGKYLMGVQQCAIVWCPNQNPDSCSSSTQVSDVDTFGPFSIKSSDFRRNIVFPFVNHRNYSLFEQFQYSSDNQEEFILSTDHPIQNLLVAVLYGRIYDN